MSRSRGAERLRTSGRPTALGIGAAAATVVAMATSASAQDPVLAGMIWVGLGALTVIGWIWPLAALRAVGVEVVTSSTDTQVGGYLPATVRVSARLPLAHLEVVIDDHEPQRVAPGAGDEHMPVPTRRRAVLRSLDLHLSADAPLGFLRARRRLRVDLPSPLHVGPRPIPASWRRDAATDTQADAVGRQLVGHSDVVRTVRPYRAGDPSHLVHWPSSARTASLVVRELEPPVRDALVVVVRLASSDATDPAEEEAVSRAAGVVADALADGAVVVLCTCEDGMPIAAEVTSRFQLNRRLAAAGPGEPGRPPATARSWPTVQYGSSRGNES